jgi:hypothetical protein
VDNATHVGLDVHRDTIAVAILASGDASPDERTIPATDEALTRLIRSLRGRGDTRCLLRGRSDRL